MYNLNREIDLIPDEGIKYWTQTAIASLPKEFFHNPSSLSGMWHPADEHCDGGEILHTKRVFMALYIMLNSESHKLDKIKQSECLAAALLHDSAYNTEYREYHPHCVKPYLTMKLGPKFANKYPHIMQLIEEHMGRWSINESYFPKELESHLLSLADTIVAKTYVKFPIVDDLTEEQLLQLMTD